MPRRVRNPGSGKPSVNTPASGAGWGGAAKGASGRPANPFGPSNPGAGTVLPGAGRGKKATPKSTVRTATREQMMGVYVEVALDPKQPGMARIAAADKWQDRTEGRVPQANINGGVDDMDKIADRLARGRERAAQR